MTSWWFAGTLTYAMETANNAELSAITRQTMGELAADLLEHWLIGDDTNGLDCRRIERKQWHT